MLPCKKSKRQQGSILLMVLLLTALMAALSTQLLLKGRIEIDRGNQVALNDRLYLDLQGYQYWAIQTLGSYPPKQGFLPAVFTPNLFEDISITGEWQDEQGRFNVNALAQDVELQSKFVRLLQMLQPHREEEEAKRMVHAIIRYLAKVTRIYNISELRSIPEISQEVYLSLAHYLTALPNKQHKININGIDMQDPKVLMMVFDKPSSLSDIKSLMICKGADVIKTAIQFEIFLNCIHKKNAVFKKEQLTFFSRYFLAIGRAWSNEQVHTLYTFLEKNEEQKKPSSIQLIWQSLNTR